LRSELEAVTREETDRLKEQLEQVQARAIEDENVMRQQVSESFEKKRAKLEEEHENQIVLRIV
jgi:tetrahydromethanopterin S-methyltransferase subunit A